MRPFAALSIALPLVLTLSGCSASFDPLSSPSVSAQNGPAISGRIHGGRQAVVGARVFLFENGITGDAGPSIAPGNANKSISLLCRTGVTCDPGTALDSTGDATDGDFYVLSNAQGGFGITGDYTCDAGRQVYLYALGGMPDGQTENDASAYMASLGSCPGTSGTSSFSPSLFIYMNEVSTVALAYAAAGYTSDATHISHSGTSLATTGIANAFANAAQLYDISDNTNGIAPSARATTPNGQGTVPRQLLNSLGNTLAACVNSSGSASPQCSVLFSNARFSGSTGTAPTDTATAAINIAHNPGNAVTTLFQLPTPTGYPFAPNLGVSTPNDFTVAIAFPYLPTMDITNSQPPVIDASGNVWLGNSSTDNSVNGGKGSLLRYSPLGDLTMFTTSISTPDWLAFDSSNVGWVTNEGSSGFFTLGPDQTTPTTIASPFPDPQFLAFDRAGQAWINQGESPFVDIVNASGVPVTGSPFALSNLQLYLYPQSDHAGHINALGFNSAFSPVISQASFSGGSLQQTTYVLPNMVAYNLPFLADSSDNLWTYAMAPTGLALQEFSNQGVLLHSFPALPALSLSYLPAEDGAGVFWTTDGNVLSAQNSAGQILTPASGYQYNASAPTHPVTLAVDGSGNVWVFAVDFTSTYEYVSVLIGAATPVITPISPNNPANPVLTGLGVRP